MNAFGIYRAQTSNPGRFEAVDHTGDFPFDAVRKLDRDEGPYALICGQ